ncbi:MAG: hypothetical protein ACTSVO_07870 [Candidatus Heimdallarchaeaceae archaeon]
MLHTDHEPMYLYPQELGMIYENITFSTSDIIVPTYLIHGNADLDINPEDSTIIFNELPGSTVKLLWRVDDRGHVEAYLEQDYFSRVTQFITDKI